MKTLTPPEACGMDSVVGARVRCTGSSGRKWLGVAASHAADLLQLAAAGLLAAARFPELSASSRAVATHYSHAADLLQL